MQRSATATPTPVDSEPDATCPVCGEPVRGIATARPGEHRFVGCDHYASARLLGAYANSPSTAADPRRIGP